MKRISFMSNCAIPAKWNTVTSVCEAYCNMKQESNCAFVYLNIMGTSRRRYMETFSELVSWQFVQWSNSPRSRAVFKFKYANNVAICKREFGQFKTFYGPKNLITYACWLKCCMQHYGTVVKLIEYFEVTKIGRRFKYY